MLVTSLYIINWHSDRIKMVGFLIALVFNLFFMSLLKLIYSDPRPYMSNIEIKLYECSVEYGNPSGHSYLSAFYYFLILWVYDKNLFFIIENDRLNCKRLALIVLNLLWILLIAFSRIYLGVHSLN